MALRLDIGSLRAPVYRSDGTARVDAYLTRVGVFSYSNPDGTVRKELRLPEEVFSADALESFEGVPLTDDHPEGAVTGANAVKLARGAVGDTVKRDGEFVKARITVLDAGLIAKMKAGKVELSCGYTCDLERKPGEHPVHGRYDAVQRNIRGNHVAVVSAGRAGSDVRARMDAADAIMIESAECAALRADMERLDPTATAYRKILARAKALGVDSAGFEARWGDRYGHKEILRMDSVTVTINGVEYDVTPQVAQALGAERKLHADAADKLAVAVKRADDAEGASKVLTAQLAEKSAALASATDPAKIAAAVAARADLQAIAGKHGVKCDGLTDAQVKIAIVKAVAKTDVTEAEVDGAFKVALASAGNAGVDNARRATNDATRSDVAPDLAAIRAKMVDELHKINPSQKDG
jgi:hypothetical protein